MCMSDMLNKMTADAANILNRGIRKENEMENTFVVNIIHRPEMVPEYAEKVTGKHFLQNRWTYLSFSRRLHIRMDLKLLFR